MKESADELYHFTRTMSNVVSIMRNKFKPFFCIEDLSHMYSGKNNLLIAYPMVCFCDIPIKRTAEHRKSYGNYGVALSKEWGIKNNFSIVDYSFDKSLKSSSYRILAEYYSNNHAKMDDTFKNLYKNTVSILIMVTKPYEGRKFDNEKSETESFIREISNSYSKEELSIIRDLIVDPKIE